MSAVREESRPLLKGAQEQPPLTYSLYETSHIDSQNGVDSSVGGVLPECSSRDMRSSPVYRYIMIVLISFIAVGDYYCTASPSGLQTQILDDLHISETKYMSFFSNLQWTGIVSCLFGGFLIDRLFGNRLGIVMFAFLVPTVHALYALGALLNSYWLMFVMRGVYGLVDAPMNIANDNISVKWFKHKGISMAFGLKTSFPRVGSVAALNVLGPIYNYLDQFLHGHACLGITLLSGTLVALLSFISAVSLALIDRKADTTEHVTSGEHTTKESEKVVRLSDIKDFPLTYWLIAVTTTVFYMGVMPFVGLGQVYFETKYNLDSNIADNVNSMVYLIGAITLPVFGFVIDKTGKSVVWMFIGILLSVVSHTILTFTFIQPYVPMVLLGFGYSIFTATIWPMVAFVMTDHLGTAFGIMNSIVLTGQAVAAYIAGVLTDTRGYFILELFFLSCITISLLIGILLYIADRVKDGSANLSSSERSKRT